MVASESATSGQAAPGRRGQVAAQPAPPGRAAPRVAGRTAASGGHGASGHDRVGRLGAASSGGGLLEDDVGVGAADRRTTRRRRGAGAPVSGQSLASVSSSTAPADQSTCGDGSSTCSVCGSTPCRMAMTILMTPATPAAAWVWPMLDLTEPSQQRPLGRALLAVGGEQRLRLDRVAERGAGAVRLDRVDVGAAEAGVGQRLADDPLLGRAVRRGQAVATRRPGSPPSRAPPPARGGRCAGRRTAAPPAAADALGPARAVRARPRTPCSGRPAARPPCRLNSTKTPGRGHHRHTAGQRHACTRRCAAPGRPGAAPPARTSTPCRR